MGHRSAELSELLAFRIWAAISLFTSRGICSPGLSPRLPPRQAQLGLRLGTWPRPPDSPSQRKLYMSGLYGTIGSREKEPNIGMDFFGFTCASVMSSQVLPL